MKHGGVLAAALLLAACTSAARHPEPPPDSLDTQTPRLKEAEIHADLIQQMLGNGQYYAALAHIEEQQRAGRNDQLDLLEAEARRHLHQQPQAEALYRRLLQSPYAAQAYHGLGMLTVDSDLDGAIRNLRRAVERAPTNVDFRNDLGYALMTAGRYTEAMPELSTAAELAPTQVRARKNLIILALVGGREADAQRMAQEWGITADLRQLRDTAQAIRSRQNAKTAKAAG